MIDDLNTILDVITAIHDTFPMVAVSVRPHPAEITARRKILFKSICKQFSLQYSDSQFESAQEFLQRNDAIIAGESSIILEATLMNVYPFLLIFLERKWTHMAFLLRKWSIPTTQILKHYYMT